MIKNLNWIYFVCKRFSHVDAKGSSSITTKLSTLGICFGVMTLIAVLSVMNGFQLQFIDSIIELSSYHVQITDYSDNDKEEIENFLYSDNNVVSFTEFREAQCLMTDKYGKESAALIRAVPETVLLSDEGFAKEMNMISGEFDLTGENSIVLGARLAKALGVRKGSKVNLFALSGTSDTALISNDRTFKVSGIFSCGYADINASYAYISLSTAENYFGSIPASYGIKLENQNYDRNFERNFIKKFPDFKVSAWRDYNRSFFGALRIEKNMLFLLVIMIFIVVTINIYNSMRKLVFERRVEISTLSTLGADNFSIQNVFILRALLIGLKGALTGMILGLLISFNISAIFISISKVQWFFSYLFASIFNPSVKDYIRENAMWYIYADIPAKVIPGEVIFITLFGIISCLVAAFAASHKVLNMKIAEVFHEE